jgi:Asp-tRNA(Asn)/Glu-tRNA(Gln) amidotransferase B subunit
METLIALCNKVVFDPKTSSQLEQYTAGEERKKWKIEKYFSGKIMAASRGNAHPELMKEALSVVLQNACTVS